MSIHQQRKRLPDAQLYKVTDLGREKLCRCCDQFLPHDDEFYRWLGTRGHYFAYCRACEAQQRRERHQRRRSLTKPTEGPYAALTAQNQAPATRR